MQHLTDMLAGYGSLFKEERAMVGRITALIRDHEDCLLRSCVPGHITASAWILCPEGRKVLLTRHRKLQKWLQLGGHVDGEADPLTAALSEAREESGMERFQVLWPHGEGIPLDVDVHTIPARKDELEHEHHDLRFLLQAEPGQTLTISEESEDLGWFTPQQVRAMTRERSLLRMLEKTERWQTP